MAIELNIPTPCHEKWSEMPPVRHDCRHCATCDRQIVDFTLKTDAEILEYLQRGSGKICGRFAKEQIGRPLMAVRNAKRSGVTAIAASVAAALAAQQPTVPPTVVPVSTEQVPTDTRIKMGKLALVEDAEPDSMRTISGKVLDETGEILIGASVVFAKTTIRTQADVTGNFSLKVPLDILQNNPLEIQISYTGYSTKTVAIAQRILQEDLSLLPEQTQLEDSFSGIVGEIVYLKPPKSKSGVRHFFHKLFH